MRYRLHLRYIPDHDVSRWSKKERWKGLPKFHSYTGCDTVSSLYGIGKNHMERMTDIRWSHFLSLSSPKDITSLDIEVLQHSRILSYEYCPHREKVFSWICPSNSRCPNSTHLMCCFLSWSHLGIDVCCLSWDSRCWEVGLETNTDKWIEAILDYRGRHFIHMQ